MKIDRGSFINVFIEKNLRQYSIPVYQRNYEWTAEQCEKLFEDFIQAHKLDKYSLSSLQTEHQDFLRLIENNSLVELAEQA